MRQVLKWTVAVAVVTVILIGVVAGSIRIWLASSLPDPDGTVLVPGLTEKVTVIRDSWGGPHITAANGPDAWQALGYTVAQDRLFQMEIQRRLAKGELAEIFGPSVLDVDRLYRTLMLRRQAETYLSEPGRIGAETLAALDAFLEGVNRFVATGPLPAEFTLLGADPQPFTRLDTLAMMGYVAYSFGSGIRRDSLYTMLQPHLTRADMALVFPDYTLENRRSIMEPEGLPETPVSGRGTRPVPDLSAGAVAGTAPPALGGTAFDGLAFDGLATGMAAVTDRASDFAPPFMGSNSWVLAPTRSESGHALLANDPHIGIANPGVWYEAHVRFPGYENYGYHLPLLPFPMLAHNRHRAWAVTMFENDDMDLYAETFHPDHPDQVLYKREWTRAELFTETIRVKGEADQSLTIRKTPHGPVISDFIPGYEGKPVSLSWIYLNEENPILDVAFGMATADNLIDFRNAVSRLAAPGLNISYIDRKGNIAWWACGRQPIRPPHVTGKEILDGSSGKDDPLGVMPFDMNPQMVNPPSGIIVTANQLPTFNGGEPAGPYTGYYRPSDRGELIYDLLQAREKWDLASMKAIQTDARIPAGTSLAGQISQILAPERDQLDKTQARALDILAAWDGTADIRSTGATVFHFTTYHILKEALEPHLGPDHLQTYLNLTDYWDALKQMLKTPGVPVVGKRNTVQPRSRKELVLAGLRAAVEDMRDRLGRDPEDWVWGTAHIIEFAHPLGRKKPLNLLFNIGPFPCPGEFTAINRMRSKAGRHDYRVKSIPSTRRLIDGRDMAGSWAILPTGNAGNVTGPFYDNQAALYMNDAYRNIVFTEDQIRADTAHTLTLVPEQEAD